MQFGLAPEPGSRGFRASGAARPGRLLGGGANKLNPEIRHETQTQPKLLMAPARVKKSRTTPKYIEQDAKPLSSSKELRGLGVLTQVRV